MTNKFSQSLKGGTSSRILGVFVYLGFFVNTFEYADVFSL